MKYDLRLQVWFNAVPATQPNVNLELSQGLGALSWLKAEPAVVGLRKTTSACSGSSTSTSFSTSTGSTATVVVGEEAADGGFWLQFLYALLYSTLE